MDEVDERAQCTHLVELWHSCLRWTEGMQGLGAGEAVGGLEPMGTHQGLVPVTRLASSRLVCRGHVDLSVMDNNKVTTR